jgi:Ca2+-binding EF-hand superfamily protein
MFESKDKDQDGRLSFEEFMGEQSRAERLFKIMDKDGDGFVTKNVSFGLSW